MTALGLVHVMGRDKHRQPVRGERVNLVPEFASRLGVDARRWFVEQQQIGRRQNAGAEREPLLPAARQFRRQLRLAALQSQPLDRGARGTGGVAQAEDARDEFEILADGQILIKREALRHVANAALDLPALGQNVMAEAGSLAAVGRQQTAKHADGRRLARAVRPQKTINLAAPDAHRQVLHHRAPAEGFRQPAHVDGDVGTRRDGRGHGAAGRTVTGCPTWNCSG